MKHLSPRTRRNRGGAAAIEFAMVLPILLALILGMIDFGYYFIQEGYVVSAAREGARLGVTYDESAGPGTYAQSRARSVLTEHGLTGTVTTSLSGTSPQRVLTVTVSVPYQPLVGFIHFPSGFDLHGRMTMLLESQP